MNTKIQELTDIIYKEGVTKGQEEAERILAEAGEKARQIVAEARKEADKLIADAKKESQNYSDNVKKELKLSASQSIDAVKSEIATVITDKIVSESVAELVNDKDLMGEFILKIAGEWAKSQDIVISTSDSAGLKKLFASKAKQLLDKGVTIEQVNGRKAGFTIAPYDGSYKVNFGAEEFVNWFKSMVRPQLVETLF
ncbi:MAG: hypothetical protein J5732_07150 [Bacteroidaceae bacterium]|nr:hypothetical protein [Bacteroidaceae bacterium]